MLKKRKRINVSLDIETYDKLQHMCKQYRVNGCPTLLVAFAHMLLDCMDDAEERRLNMADGDRAYLLNKFDMFGHVQRQPDGTVPKRGCKKNIDTWQKTKNIDE